jgi:hypothetical protein
MPVRPLERLAPLLLASLAFAPDAATRPWEPQRSPGATDAPAVRRAAAALAAVREARAAGRPEDDARLRLVLALAEEVDGRPLLARPDELGRALTLAEAEGRPRAPRGAKVETVTLGDGNFRDTPLELALRLPKDGPGPAGHPLIIALPEVDEDPAEHLRARFGGRGAVEGAIVLVPRLPASRAAWELVSLDGRPGGVAHVLTALRYVNERLPIDPDRIVLVGRASTAPVALAVADHAPHRFAGLALIAADALERPPHNLRNLPLLLVGGGQGAEDLAARMAALGFQEPRRDVTLDDDGLVAWARERRRDAAPSTASLVVGQPYPTRVDWVRVAPSAMEATARVSVDRSSNTVRVLASGVSAVTLHLSDALVDLSKPVHVDFEQRTTSLTLERSVATLVDRWLDGTSDTRTPYVAELVVVPGVGPLIPPPAAPAADGPYLERLAEAERAARDNERAEPLWELLLWCRSSGRHAREGELLAKVLRFEPDHAPARQAAGHVRAPGEATIEWFHTAEARDRWLARQQPAIATALGHVEHAGRWMHPKDREWASRGARKDPETGLWWTPEDLRRARLGASRQDLEWLDAESTALADAGLWRVQGDWLALTEANRRRSELAHAWRIPAWHVELTATVDREVALRAIAVMEDTLPALHHVFGVEPALPLRAALLRDEEQYDRFAFGDPDGRRAATHTRRLHTIHSAFFAESWFERVDGRLAFRGAGAGYWDANAPNGAAYGLHAARLAYALSYVDALDPSPKAVQKALPSGPTSGFAEAYEAEKSLPRWLRIGGAVYAERWFHDARAAARGGDPWWARTWSQDNLRRLGGARPAAELLVADLDPDDRTGALRTMLELGALVAFLVDGGDPTLAALHEELLTSLRAGRVRPAAVQALEEGLRARSESFQRFAAGS